MRSLGTSLWPQLAEFRSGERAQQVLVVELGLGLLALEAELAHLPGLGLGRGGQWGHGGVLLD